MNSPQHLLHSVNAIWNKLWSNTAYGDTHNILQHHQYGSNRLRASTYQLPWQDTWENKEKTEGQGQRSRKQYPWGTIPFQESKIPWLPKNHVHLAHYNPIFKYSLSDTYYPWLLQSKILLSSSKWGPSHHLNALPKKKFPKAKIRPVLGLA